MNPPMPRRERVHVVVDDAVIAEKDHWTVIHPVWYTANIYEGPGAYEFSLQSFSQAQRMVHAVLWYMAEVNNGGHRQFYSNSTGIVWRDAMAGMEAIGLPRGARIIAISAERMGGEPSLDRADRREQMETIDPEFDDLDDAFYALEKRNNIDELISNYIRGRPSDFHFDGEIERTVLPSLTKKTKGDSHPS
jgi:hypothetical protein